MVVVLQEVRYNIGLANLHYSQEVSIGRRDKDFGYGKRNKFVVSGSEGSGRGSRMGATMC